MSLHLNINIVSRLYNPNPLMPSLCTPRRDIFESISNFDQFSLVNVLESLNTRMQNEWLVPSQGLLRRNVLQCRNWFSIFEIMDIATMSKKKLIEPNMYNHVDVIIYRCFTLVDHHCALLKGVRCSVMFGNDFVIFSKLLR